jgi:hypothetical protein
MKFRWPWQKKNKGPFDKKVEAKFWDDYYIQRAMQGAVSQLKSNMDHNIKNEGKARWDLTVNEQPWDSTYPIPLIITDSDSCQSSYEIPDNCYPNIDHCSSSDSSSCDSGSHH